MADLRSALAGNAQALSFLQFFENAGQTTQKQIGAIIAQKLEKIDVLTQQKQRQEVQRQQSEARLLSNQHSVLQEGNFRPGRMAEYEPHQPRNQHHPLRRAQSQNHLRAASRESSVPSAAQGRQLCQHPQGDHGTFGMAPFSGVQSGLARKPDGREISPQNQAQLKPSSSRRPASLGLEQRKARHEQERKEQRLAPQRRQEATKLKRTSKPQHNFKACFDKCTVPPRAIYPQREEEIEQAPEAHRTCGRSSSKPTHHFWQNRRNQMTNQEISQHYAKQNLHR